MEEFNIDCSDEEFIDCQESWEPPPEVIEKYYDQLCNGEIPELSWKCPGYRTPSPDVKESQEEDTEAKMSDDKSDFDFMDEASTPRLKIRKGDEVLKGSAKKKTTSLDGVINNMRRHNLLPN